MQQHWQGDAVWQRHEPLQHHQDHRVCAPEPAHIDGLAYELQRISM
jgi:hypothetical protein